MNSTDLLNLLKSVATDDLRGWLTFIILLVYGFFGLRFWRVFLQAKEEQIKSLERQIAGMNDLHQKERDLYETKILEEYIDALKKRANEHIDLLVNKIEEKDKQISELISKDGETKKVIEQLSNERNEYKKELDEIKYQSEHILNDAEDSGKNYLYKVLALASNLRLDPENSGTFFVYKKHSQIRGYIDKLIILSKVKFSQSEGGYREKLAYMLGLDELIKDSDEIILKQYIEKIRLEEPQTFNDIVRTAKQTPLRNLYSVLDKYFDTSSIR